MTFYTPRHVTQRDASDPRAFSHCWAAVGAWMLDGATDGASKVTAKEFARMAGGGSGRQTGSGTHEDIVQGLDRYGVKSTLVRMSMQDATTILSSERRAIWALALDYDAYPEGKDCMGGEAGPDVNHEVGIIGGSPPQTMNPLCRDYQVVALPRIIEAAFKYAKQQGHSRWIETVRVYRQKPTGTIADKAVIADLRDQLEQWEQYAATVRRLAGDILDVAVPK